MEMSILLIDKQDFAHSFFDKTTHHGFYINWRQSLDESSIDCLSYDLIVLDPAWYENVREFIAHRRDLKILIFTMINDVNLIESFLDVGAVDFLSKSALPWEFCLRAKRLVRKSTPLPNSEVLVRDTSIGSNLTLNELKILTAIWRAPKGLATRDYLQKAIWGNVNVQRNNLDVHIYNLRKKISHTSYRILFGKGAWFVTSQKAG